MASRTGKEEASPPGIVSATLCCDAFTGGAAVWTGSEIRSSSGSWAVAKVFTRRSSALLSEAVVSPGSSRLPSPPGLPIDGHVGSPVSAFEEGWAGGTASTSMIVRPAECPVADASGAGLRLISLMRRSTVLGGMSTVSYSDPTAGWHRASEATLSGSLLLCVSGQGVLTCVFAVGTG